MEPDDLDFELLRELSAQPAASQRSLASHLGVSVGKLNYCLKALIAKGWVKASNFRRSDNKMAYAYLLTPSGMAAKMRLMKHFLQRKEREYETLHNQIETLRFELAKVSLPAIEPPKSPDSSHGRSTHPTKS